MFEKSLQDLVKGIRAHKRDPSSFISTSIAECKQELRSVDAFVKAQAVRKLTYLQMMGYDVSWASFAIVETMSQARFAHKRIGYLAACQCFSESTDVVLLTTNLLKKEFQSTSQYEVGLAVNCLANIVTLDLARDLLGDSVLLMSHTKPYVRKKAVSAMFKLFMQYPHGLRLTFDKFKERLGDPESAVTSCAVNVICELAHKNPSNYLSMAPQFFRLLTTSSNNWMLIKVVKLLGSLVPEEPRLARKLLEPLATIIQNTQAKSLQYECIHTLTRALPFTKKADGAEARNVPGIVKLCAEHLRGFIEDADQNLKYLGLVGFVELMQSHPKAVVEHKELVLLCLSDDDITIRTRALELLTGMVTRRNLEELVVKLLSHVARADGTYRDELISRIVFMCSRDKYAYLSDFAWYLSVLVQLAHLRGSKHGGLLAEQLVDVTMRVRPIRRYAARDMVVLLLDDQLTCGQGLESIADVLAAAAWIAGEYAASLAGDEDDDDDDEEDDADAARVGPPRPTFPKARLHEKLVDILTHPRVANLPPRVQNVYLQNALKVLALACGSTEVSDDELSAALDLVAKRGDVFLQSVHMEVQERAASLRGILEAFGALARGGAVDVAAARRCAGVLAALAAEKMAPVNPKAQARVPAPDGMDLGASVATVAVMKSFFEERDSARVAAHVSESPASLPFDEAERRVWASVRFVDAPFADDDDADGFDDAGDDAGAFEKIKDPEAPNVSVRATSAKANSAGTLGDPFYLSSAAPEAEAPTRARADDGGKRRGKKGATGDDAPRRRRVHKADVDVSELNPAGWVDSDDEKKARKKKPSARREAGRDSADLADVDITTPLRADEFIPKNEHRVVSQTPQPSTAVFKLDSAAAPAVGEKKKKKKPKDAPRPRRRRKTSL
ncbi:adaptin N terminal region-domain-containing protein [Pelagophyceae sp. CCMP2097]|nr:adaptin N terminal region-domain-containing protein [Pelagophyceae sp. CCMP2097]